MAIEFLRSVYLWVASAGERLAQGRGGMFRTALVTLGICLLLAFPSRLANLNPETEGWEPILDLIDNPFQNMAALYPHDGHAAKLTYRITMPALGHYLGLGPVGLCVVQYLMGVLQFYLVAKIAQRLTSDPVIPLFFGLAFGSTYAGLACFNYTHPYFDGAAICLLCVAIYFRHPAIILPALFLAAFTDERAFIASSLVLVYHAYQSMQEGRSLGRALVSPSVLAVYGCWATYFVARTAMTTAYELETSASGVGLEVFWAQWATLRFGIWAGIDGGWILVFVALIAMWRSRFRGLMILYLGAIGVLIAVTVMVTDINRGSIYVAPAVLIALAVLARTEKPGQLRGLIATAAIVSLLCGHYQVHGDKPFWIFYSLPVRVIQFLL